MLEGAAVLLFRVMMLTLALVNRGAQAWISPKTQILV